MRFTPIAQTAAIVAGGNLNPAIFHPSWLRLHDVISPQELQVAEKSISVVHSEISEFTIDTLAFQVTQDRISIQTTEMPFVKIADIMTTIFGGLLYHTPLKKLGINLAVHIDLESATRRFALGRAMAPLAPWGPWATNLDDSASFATKGGLRTLALEEWNFPDREDGSYRRVQIEPSLLAKPPRATDVFMLVNDHYELKPAQTTEPFVSTLKARFDASIVESLKIISDVMDFAAKFD